MVRRNRKRSMSKSMNRSVSRSMKRKKNKTYKKKSQKTKKTQKTEKQQAKSKKKSYDSGIKPSNHNNISACVKLFRKYKLTDQKKMVKWVNYNHEDKAKARGEAQSNQLKDDYKFISGCFGIRKKVFEHMKSSKPLSKSKSKKVLGISP